MDMQHQMQMRMGGPGGMLQRGPYPRGMPPISSHQTPSVAGPGQVSAVDAGGNPLDPYDHLVRQQQGGMGPRGPFPPQSMAGSPMMSGPRGSAPATSMASMPSGGGPLAAMQQQFSGVFFASLC
jgi:hypothetical protein